MNPTSDSKTEPYNVEQIRTYCRLEVKPDLADMQWDRLEEATRSTIETIKSTHRSQLLVDLSHLPTIRSGTVASLVRIWKSLNKKSRRFVVVSPHDRVRKELESAGLQKLWTIVATGKKRPTNWEFRDVPNGKSVSYAYSPSPHFPALFSQFWLR